MSDRAWVVMRTGGLFENLNKIRVFLSRRRAVAYSKKIKKNHEIDTAILTCPLEGGIKRAGPEKLPIEVEDKP